MRPMSHVKVTARRIRTYWERGAIVPHRIVPVERAPLNSGMSMAITITMQPRTATTWSGDRRTIRTIASTKNPCTPSVTTVAAAMAKVSHWSRMPVRAHETVGTRLARRYRR